MTSQLNEKVDVIAIYKKLGGQTLPYKIKWDGKIYKIIKIGYQHRIKIGNVIHHIFHVSSKSLAFRLNFDTEILSWTLEEVSDGLAD